MKGHLTVARVSACLLALAGPARSELVNIDWQAGDRYERSLTVAPGKFAELCGPLKAGQSIQWSFKAERALNFNIHYHVDKDVRYPAKRDQVKRLQGLLAVDTAQDYCWMWVNKTGSASPLAVTLSRQ